MTTYQKLITKLEQAPDGAWRHQRNFAHSVCTINGVECTLYADGQVGVADGLFYKGGFFEGSRDGRALFLRLRVASGVPWDRKSNARAALERLEL